MSLLDHPQTNFLLCLDSWEKQAQVEDRQGTTVNSCQDVPAGGMGTSAQGNSSQDLTLSEGD